ncbi:hypothetical protein ACFQ3W_21550 [Paenibacillus puldeungensis]|uniref:Uncharacterized protein n=1 Tax=Paenibacillus puldeungensis TaxID=696536 RepID=A0ABW3S255_9BACL
MKINDFEEKIIDNSFQTINEWWIESTADIHTQDQLIYCVEINGQSFYAGYEQLIVDNYQRIDFIRIVTKTKGESIEETFVTVKDYLDKFIPASSSIADSFYGELTDKEWSKFSQLIEGIEWILKAMDFLETLTINEKQKRATINMKIEIERIVSEMDNNLQRQDYVMVGDLIQYELVTALQNYMLEIQG